jgi:hypothetical protein
VQGENAMAAVVATSYGDDAGTDVRDEREESGKARSVGKGGGAEERC